MEHLYHYNSTSDCCYVCKK